MPKQEIMCNILTIIDISWFRGRALLRAQTRERSNAPAYAREDRRPSFCVGVALCSLMALSDAESPIDFPMASARVCVCG